MELQPFGDAPRFGCPDVAVLPLGGQDGWCPNHHPPPRTRTTLQRPHLARRCPGRGWPLPVTLKPQSGHSMLQRNFSRSLRTFRWVPPLFCSGGFAGCFAGGVREVREVRSPCRGRRAAPRSVSRWAWTGPAASFYWSCSPLVSVAPGPVRVTAVTSMFRIPPSGRCAPSFR